MANSTITLAQALTAGAKLAVDTITGLFNGAAPPADAVAQYAKMAYGAPNTLQGVDDNNPLPAAAPLRATLGMTPAAVNLNTAGDTTVVAAVTGQTTRVHRLVLVVGGATNLVIKRGTTALTGTMPFSGPGSMVLDFSERPHFVTGANEAFVVSSSAAVQVGGFVQYVTGA